MSHFAGVPKNLPLPEPVLDASGNHVAIACPICGATNLGAPPHGEGMPCPLAIRQEAALEKLALLREKESDQSAFMMNDLKALLQNMGIVPEEDE